MRLFGPRKHKWTDWVDSLVLEEEDSLSYIRCTRLIRNCTRCGTVEEQNGTITIEPKEEATVFGQPHTVVVAEKLLGGPFIDRLPEVLKANNECS